MSLRVGETVKTYSGVAAMANMKELTADGLRANSFNIVRPAVSTFSSGGGSEAIFTYVFGVHGGVPGGLVPVLAHGSFRLETLVNPYDLGGPEYQRAYAQGEMTIGVGDHQVVADFELHGEEFPWGAEARGRVMANATGNPFYSGMEVQSNLGNLDYEYGFGASGEQVSGSFGQTPSAVFQGTFSGRYGAFTNSNGYALVQVVLLSRASFNSYGDGTGFAASLVDPFLEIDPVYLAGNPTARIELLYGLKNEPFQAAVPEPSSWALLIAGFGLVGASVRRRKADAASSCASGVPHGA